MNYPINGPAVEGKTLAYNNKLYGLVHTNPEKFENIAFFLWFGQTIANRGDWLWSPANIKGANKDAKIYVAAQSFVLPSHTIQLYNYSVLCFVQGQGQKTEQ